MRRLWLWAIGAALLLVPLEGGAQRLSYNSGQPIAPAYEGFTRNPDGSFTLMFGYMNQNWEQEPDVPWLDILIEVQRTREPARTREHDVHALLAEPHLAVAIGDVAPGRGREA